MRRRGTSQWLPVEERRTVPMKHASTRQAAVTWLILMCAIGEGEISEQYAGAAEPEGSLRKAFAAPPSEYRLVPIRSGGALRSPKLPEWLAERHAGGVVLDASTPKTYGAEPWVDPTYLDNPVTFQQLRDMMTRLKANDQKVWLYDELGYPSGNAGGRVLDNHPEFAAQALRCRSLLTSGQSLKIAAPGQRVISCRAYPRRAGGVLDLGTAIDLTSKIRAGSLDWTPPAGNWTVCLFERFVPDTWKRHNIARRNINIMDRRAVARFIELTHERYAKELGPQLDDVVLFFTDEPQLSAVEPWGHGAFTETLPAVHWCDELPVWFERKKGYPITRVLPALFHNVGPAAVRLAHQREPGREIILVANPSAKGATGELVCAFGGNVSVWNPETGEIQEFGVRKDGANHRVSVPADSARFVVFD